MLKVALLTRPPLRAETRCSLGDVLASLRGTVKRETKVSEELRPCLGQGASLSENAWHSSAVLARVFSDSIGVPSCTSRSMMDQLEIIVIAQLLGSLLR